MKISVIGAGSWGTALAQVLSDNSAEVVLWVRSPRAAEEIRKNGENKRYLPGANLSKRIYISEDLEGTVHGADIVVVAVPSHAMNATAKSIGGLLERDAIVVSASKGLEVGSFRRMSQVLQEELPSEFKKQVAVLSGPSHAEEVVIGLPTTIVAASESKQVAKTVQDAFMRSRFRVYTNPDVVGVELGGALKNTIALCSGIADGLGLGDNTKAALITRGIVEMTRLGVKLGARKATFSGLSGIGDLIVTCSSMLSRNRRAGIEIGKGKTVEQAMESVNMVVEGVNTAKVAYRLSKVNDVEMPITEEAYAVLFEHKTPKEALNALMGREGKHEMEDLVFDEGLTI